MKKLKILMVAGAATMLSSCDLSQIPGLDGKLSLEDSKAIGAACRHSGRALEDCFTMNPNTHQAGVFDGWRDMNDYMVANRLDVVKPEIQTSAFKPDNISAEQPHSAAPIAPGKGGAPPSAASGNAVPLAQGRQRWSPKGDAEVVEESPPKVEESVQQKPLSDEKSAAEVPSRPWERKKDPKKHT